MRLTERERQVLSRMTGTNRSQLDIAAELGISRMRVTQLKQVLMAKGAMTDSRDLTDFGKEALNG